MTGTVAGSEIARKSFYLTSPGITKRPRTVHDYRGSLKVEIESPRYSIELGIAPSISCCPEKATVDIDTVFEPDRETEIERMRIDAETTERFRIAGGVRALIEIDTTPTNRVTRIVKSKRGVGLEFATGFGFTPSAVGAKNGILDQDVNNPIAEKQVPAAGSKEYRVSNDCIAPDGSVNIVSAGGSADERHAFENTVGESFVFAIDDDEATHTVTAGIETSGQHYPAVGSGTDSCTAGKTVAIDLPRVNPVFYNMRTLAIFHANDVSAGAASQDQEYRHSK